MSGPAGLLPDDPSAWALPPGWELRYRPVTGSTNDDAKAAARAGAPGRTVFLANEQTAGRGRRGRRWVAPPDACLLFSLLLRDPQPPIILTALCSVAVAEAVQNETGLEARIKWPNDLMIGERKVCGLLTEVVGAGAEAATVVGIGLNVNLDLRWPSLPPTATSLSAELGRPLARADLLRAVLTCVDHYLGLGPSQLPTQVYASWEQRLWRKRQKVRLADGRSVWEGVVEGLAPSGALRLRASDGRLWELSTGEVLL